MKLNFIEKTKQYSESHIKVFNYGNSYGSPYEGSYGSIHIDTVSEYKNELDEISKKNKIDSPPSFLLSRAPKDYLLLCSESDNYTEFTKLMKELKSHFKNPVDKAETAKKLGKTKGGKERYTDIVKYFKYNTPYGIVYYEWYHDGCSGGYEFLALSKTTAKKAGLAIE